MVGCGLSGLSAARRVLRERPGARVVLVEARERVGGRTQVAESGHGTYVDLGGAYVGPTQDAVLRVAGEMGVETYPVFCQGDIMFKDPHSERVGRGTVAQPALLSTWELLDFNAALCRFDALAFSTVLDVSRPDLAPEAERLDQISVREWSRRHIQSEAIRATFPVVLDTLLCKPSDEISMLYYLWYARSGDSLKRLMDIENGAQERKFVGGSASISIKLADELRAAGARVELSWPVHSVKQLAGGAVLLTCRDGRSVRAKTAIVALAPSLYRSIAWSPELPAGKEELGHAFSMGSIVKTVTYYSEPWWRKKGLSGQIFSVQGPIVYVRTRKWRRDAWRARAPVPACAGATRPGCRAGETPSAARVCSSRVLTRVSKMRDAFLSLSPACLDRPWTTPSRTAASPRSWASCSRRTRASGPASRARSGSSP